MTNHQRQIKRCLLNLQKIFQTEALRIAEIGVFKGATAATLLNRFKHLHMTLVDPWQEAPPDSSYRTVQDPVAEYSQQQHEGNYQQAMRETAFAESRRTVLRVESTTAAPQVPDKTLHLVFIDANHSYQAVREDIQAWWEKVMSGGWLGGHDYRKPGNRYGVKQAVDEWTKTHQKKLVLGEGNTWWVKKP